MRKMIQLIKLIILQSVAAITASPETSDTVQFINVKAMIVST